MYLLRIHAYNHGNDFIFKETNQKTNKNITEQHKHSPKRVVGLLRHLRIFPWGDGVRGVSAKGKWLRWIQNPFPLFHPVMVYSKDWSKLRGILPYGTVEVVSLLLGTPILIRSGQKWLCDSIGYKVPSHAKKYNRLLKDIVYSFVLSVDLINLLIKNFKTWLLPLLLQKYDRIWYFHRYLVLLPCVLKMWIII